ncbi:MAG: sulfide/dihydroorotate dehydrogenase-like FAD/NAD-binding protein [Candidatus Hadarchaeales archaeon]
MRHEVLKNSEIAPGTRLMEILAPQIAGRARQGQFIILMTDEKGERIPLTLFDWTESTIKVIFEVIGRSTSKLAMIGAGEQLYSLIGPLGNPSEVGAYGKVAVVGGGVGIASCYPIARALKGAGNFVISVLGARTRELLILEREMREVSDRVIITTDDGTYGRKGLVTDALSDLLQEEEIGRVWAIGPAPMMRAVSELTRTRGIETVVSLNAIMVDGTGMCGSCRVTVGGKTRFTCVDGPEFSGHEVDWDEFIARLRRYSAQESTSMEIGSRSCGGGA